MPRHTKRSVIPTSPRWPISTCTAGGIEGAYQHYKKTKSQIYKDLCGHPRTLARKTDQPPGVCSRELQRIDELKGATGGPWNVSQKARESPHRNSRGK